MLFKVGTQIKHWTCEYFLKIEKQWEYDTTHSTVPIPEGMNNLKLRMNNCQLNQNILEGICVYIWQQMVLNFMSKNKMELFMNAIRMEMIHSRQEGKMKNFKCPSRGRYLSMPFPVPDRTAAGKEILLMQNFRGRGDTT